MDNPSQDSSFARQVGSKEKRRIHARRNGEKDAIFWVGMFGLVGWSVAIPTVVLTLLGVWIDGKDLSPYSWTLMLLFVGIVLGCANAWYWIKRESKPESDAMESKPESDDT